MNLAISINYAQALPGTPLYEYARENGYIGKDIKSEEEYLIDVSDKNANEGNQYINYSQQPLLKVLTWKHQIIWEAFRAHYHINVKLNPSKIKVFLSILIYFVNKFLNINLKYPIEKEIKSKVNDFNKSTINLLSLGKLLLPWSKFTYLVILLIIAKKESKTLGQFLFHIIEHIKWKFSYFNKNLLPDNTLRKSVEINDTDDTLKLRMGR